ncbi:Rec8 like protein-domain-containing protein [Cercophora newfieldiana]|uniref:Rec8 like protein-domain-containing protein n=1 Tax=Cercophora newfieldiana TaxID=92897 RepID=A0AA39YNI3_9PEZI|nr:Rec8 like protein-domain-containing protein [Cercophora newfieldiana]
MFYSHEILTNQKYGVATVWLVSTIGLKTTNRKITRKAIQEVDVQGACGTILKPGAPIALRLQGNLLFGVSRVYDRQCTYVLTDAEKVQHHLRTFHKTSVFGNALDPTAGRSKRDNIVLLDDPEFNLDVQLPPFMQLDDDGNPLLPQESQASRKTSSQLSPLMGDSTMNSLNSLSGGGSLLDGFDLPGSHSSRSPMKNLGSSQNIRLIESQKMGDPMSIFGNEEEDLEEIQDWGIEMDAEGNLIETVDEPELPIHPKDGGQARHSSPREDEPNPFHDNDGDIIMDFDGPPLPDAEAFPPRQEAEEASQEIPILEVAAAPARKRRQRNALAPDAETTLSRKKIKAWADDYLTNIEKARNRGRRTTTATQAKNNAYNLIFGRGLMDVGVPVARPSLTLPLADVFAGDHLEEFILGIPPHAAGNGLKRSRRTALEALELEDEEDEERRVRPRLSADPDQAGQGGNLQLPGSERGLRDDEEAIEVGREGGEALPDIHSDVPWNRPSSQIPSSSVKGIRHGSSRQVSPSPLRAHGSQLFDIERFSDQPAFGSDDFGGPMHSANNSFDDVIKGDALAPPQEPAISHAMEQALGREGTNFLTFVQTTADKKGTLRADGKKWVGFDDLFEPQDQTRAVVTQAFYHTLSLATRNVIKVEQDGQNRYAFGAIRLGVKQPLANEDED